MFLVTCGPNSQLIIPVRRKKNSKGDVEAAHKEEINSEEQWGVTQSTQNHQKQRASLKDEAI